MHLKTLLEGVNVIATQGNLAIDITGLTTDSRSVRPGYLFIAMPGFHVDGHRFIPEALDRGAVAIIVQRQGEWGDCWIQVADNLQALACISANYYEHPADHLKLIGITGSNGKTTCAFLVDSLQQTAGEHNGLLTTIECRWPGHQEDAGATTPLSIDLHRYLRQMVDAGMQSAVMEVSSHGIALKRIEGLAFQVALFTNLSQDHLDFHKTMEAYGQTKKELFLSHLKPNGKAVVNGDDSFGRELAKEIKDHEVILFSCSTEAPVCASDIELDSSGIRFQLTTPLGSLPIASPLLGVHNVENLVGAAATGVALGLSIEQIKTGLQAVKAIPGRLEPVECGQNFKVLVDYAHTPDALRRVLTLLRQLPHRRLITMFGCGGERDQLKRPLMGQVVCELSDEVVVTTDNARGESPLAIIEDIEGGIKNYESKYRVIPDRREAIVSAIEAAGESDIVLLAGKGHEVTQIWADRTVAFDDRKVAESALKNL